jgi:predicted MFS family arabinose efflux permease
MIVSLIGEHIPREQRTNVIGYTISGLALFYVAGSLLSSYIANLAGWRWAFIGIVFPVSTISLILSNRAIPTQEYSQSFAQVGDFMAGFKSVISNKSAIACVLGTTFGVASWNFYLIYGASYWRQQFSLSTGFVSAAYILTAFGYIAGSLLSGRVVKRIGSKPMVVITSLILGLVTLVVTLPKLFWVTYGITIFASLCGGMMITGFTSLTLEQIPRFRGTMMSVSSAATSLGQLLCASIGGFLLLRYGYLILGSSLGVAGVVSSLIFYAFSKDPTREHSPI